MTHVHKAQRSGVTPDIHETFKSVVSHFFEIQNSGVTSDGNDTLESGVIPFKVIGLTVTFMY